MKQKLIFLSMVCLAIFTMPIYGACKAQASPQITASAEAVKVSTQEFNNLKSTLTSAISNMKSASSAELVANSMYSYTKSFLGMNKVYKNLTDYQKKQIDTLVKQFGVQSKAKIAQYGCKKAADAAIQKATLEVLGGMSK